MASTEIFRVQAESVKDLKQQIASLRDEIVRLRSAEQDDTDAVNQLRQAESMLNDVMKAGKKEAKALEGSYDAISQKMRELKKEYQATGDAMRRAELAPQIRDLNNQLKQMDADIGNFQRNVGNYASAFSQVRQVGGDLVNGFRAFSGILTLTTSQQDRMNESASRFNTVLGVMSGMKGIGAVIDALKKYTTSAKAAKVAQDALNGSMKAGGEAGEKMGNSILKLVKNPTVILALLDFALLMGIIIAKWDDILAKVNQWMGWEKKDKFEVEEMTKSHENYVESLEKEKRERQRKLKIMEAEGKTKRELLKWEAEEIRSSINRAQAEMRVVYARMQEIKAHGFLQRLLNGENKEFKKLEKNYNEFAQDVTDLYEDLKDVNASIKAGDIKGWSTSTKNELATIVKAGQDAKEKVDKIMESSLKDLDKIDKKYEILYGQVTEYEQAELKSAKATKATAEQIEEIESRYDNVWKQLYKNKENEIRDFYKKEFDEAYKSYEKRMELSRKEKSEWKELYEGLAKDITGFATDRNIFNSLISEEKIDQLNEDLATAWKVLFDNAKDQLKTYYEFEKEYREKGALAMYDEMLKNEEEFTAKYPEPFKVALTKIAEITTQITSEERTQLKNFVTGTMAEIDEAIDRGNYGILPLLFKRLLENPPVNQSEELKTAVGNYINGILTEVTKDIVNDDTLRFGDRRTLLDLLGLSPEALKKAKADLAIKEFQTYADATVNALNGIASAWGNIITAQQNALKNQLDTGKITQEQYEELAEKMDKRAEKSFNVMKGIQYGQTVISTASGIMKVWAGEGETYYKAIMSAAVAAEGIAQLATIAGTYYNRASSISTSVPTTQAPASVSTVGLGELSASIQGNQQPIKAYIVDSELNAGMANFNQREAETSF